MPLVRCLRDAYPPRAAIGPGCLAWRGNLGRTAAGLRERLVARPSGKLAQLRFCAGLIAFLCSAAPLAAQSNQHWVYASNAQTSQLSGWVADSVLGTLTPIPGSPFDERFDPYAIAVHPNGKFLYVINKLANNVSAFSIDPNTGGLTELLGSPLHLQLRDGRPLRQRPNRSGHRRQRKIPLPAECHLRRIEWRLHHWCRECLFDRPEHRSVGSHGLDRLGRPAN